MNAVLDKLRRSYVEHLPDRIQELEDLLNKVKADPSDEVSMYSFYSLVHKISGSGTTFGLPDLSSVCAIMEARIKARLDASEPVAEAELAEFDTELASVKEIAAKALEEDAAEADEAAEKEAEAAPRPFLVLADDSVFLRQRFAITLREAGYQVEEAGNGREAIEIAQRCRPALILMDVMMPEMNGLEAARRIRANPDLRDVPIVMLTTQGTVEDVRRALAVGIDDYITKPTEPDYVVKRVRACLDKTAESGPKAVVRGRVLLVDDAVLLRRKTAAVLREAGYAVEEADNGELALKSARVLRPDLILMDMIMPDMTGLEAMAEIRQIPGMEDVPFIMITTEGTAEDVRNALDQGIMDYLTKPVDPVVVLGRVDSCMIELRDRKQREMGRPEKEAPAGGGVPAKGDAAPDGDAPAEDAPPAAETVGEEECGADA